MHRRECAVRTHKAYPSLFDVAACGTEARLSEAAARGRHVVESEAQVAGDGVCSLVWIIVVSHDV